MARQIQIRRGTAVEHENFTGAIGEITMDITNKTIRVHDGETAGGTVLAKRSDISEIATADYVIQWQNPTAENSYTWYRKYKSGWVEQGGTVSLADKASVTVTLPVTMQNSRFDILVTMKNGAEGNYSNGLNTKNYTTTSFTLVNRSGDGTSFFNWFAYGMSN